MSGCPHFKHFVEAACPRDTIVPPFVCRVEGDLPRPFLFLPLPLDLGGRDIWEVGELDMELCEPVAPRGKTPSKPSDEPSVDGHPSTWHIGVLVLLLDLMEELVVIGLLLREVGIVGLVRLSFTI